MPYVALITGASSGIGEAVARRLAREPDVALVLVARREERLKAVAAETGGTVIAADLTAPDAPGRIAAQLERQHGALHLLVNNAGARWAADFADGGWENVERHMRVNFEAPVRLTEALLPLLRRTAATGPLEDGAPADAGPLTSISAEGGQRATVGESAPSGQRATVGESAPSGRRAAFGGRPLKAPAAIVNVTSTSARISRLGTGAYSASKAALAAWSDSLALEERRHGVHVGDVLPGFIATEGFPQAELRASPLTRWAVSDVARVAEAVIEAGPGGAPEVYVPRYYWLGALLRVIAPGLIRRGASSGALATGTKSV